MRLPILRLVPFVAVIGCIPPAPPPPARVEHPQGKTAEPIVVPGANLKGKSEEPGMVPKTLPFKPAIRQFITAGKSLARVSDKTPDKVAYAKNFEKVKDLFAQIPDPPQRFAAPYKAAQQTLKDFETAAGLLDLAHQSLDAEAEAEAEMHLKQFKRESKDILKKLREIETTLEK
jgi:hypothetical protein